MKAGQRTFCGNNWNSPRETFDVIQNRLFYYLANTGQQCDHLIK